MPQGGRNGVVSENEMRSFGFESQRWNRPIRSDFFTFKLNQDMKIEYYDLIDLGMIRPFRE